MTGKVDVSTAEIKIYEANVKAPASGTKCVWFSVGWFFV